MPWLMLCLWTCRDLAKHPERSVGLLGDTAPGDYRYDTSASY